MNLRQLETFLAVADEGGFSHAADRLHVVQSAVSAAIKGLERELGAPLFVRTRRGAELTDAGRALVPEARATLAAAQAARDAVDEATGGLRGEVDLGIMQAMRAPAPNVPALLRAFRGTHPNVTVRVRHGGGSMQMAAQVREGLLDLAFVSLQGEVAGVELTPLNTQPMHLACAADHPLAGRAKVELRELAAEPFADLPPLWGTRIANDRAFAAAGVERTVAYEINDTSTLVEFVRHGLAVTLMPASLIGEASGVAQVPIGRHAPTFQVAIAAPARRRLSASARALLDEILAR